MSINRIIFFVGVVCVLVAAGIYTYAYFGQKSAKSTALQAAHITGKSSIADGTYTVEIDSITSTPDFESITFTHVTYFEGAEAKASAQHDETTCKDQPIEACVPSLSHGYYVRPTSSDFDFTALKGNDTHIVLTENKNATMDDLRNLKRDYRPVFEVSVKGNEIEKLVEKELPRL